MKNERYFINSLYKAITSHSGCNWQDALSNGQLSSKFWLLDEVKKLNLNLGKVFICAGWVGVLPALMFKDSDIHFDIIRSFDIDPACADAADVLNSEYVKNNWKFKATTLDIFDINYENHPFQCWSKSNNRMSYPVDIIPDTIINTSCDHIFPFDKWYNLIPDSKLIILQNNDYKHDDEHINNISDLEEMKSQAPMQKLLFEGTLVLSEYNRYMLIGIK